jgi:hypothetical protein
MLAKLYQLRKPKTNISIIQQNVLLKHKYFVRFLAEHGQEVYQEVGRQKVEGWMGFSLSMGSRQVIMALMYWDTPVCLYCSGVYSLLHVYKKQADADV